MLTFACTYYNGKDVPKHSKGIFTPLWADKLYRGIKRNYAGDFRFVVVTDEPKESFSEPVETLRFKNYRDNMWCIVECLRVTGRPVIFMGLDTVITGDITHMTGIRPRFAMTQDPYHEKRMCSGVMAWQDATDIYEAFVADTNRNAREYHLGGMPSDMLWLQRNGKPDMDLNAQFPGHIRSFKAHVLQDGIGDARIVYFHGRHKPHEIEHEILEHWR